MVALLATKLQHKMRTMRAFNKKSNEFLQHMTRKMSFQGVVFSFSDRLKKVFMFTENPSFSSRIT